MKEITLDKWDFQFIQYFKRADRQRLQEIKNLWAQRCAIDPHFPGLVGAIVEHFLPIIEALELSSFHEMVIKADPSKRWRYSLHTSYNAVAVQNEQYWIDWLAVVGTVLMLAEVKDLPGYVEWLEADMKMLVE